jgi:hypothetical protein
MLQGLRRLEERIDNGEASKSAPEMFRFTRNEKTRCVAMKRIHDGVLKLEQLLGSSTEIFDHSRRATRRKIPANRMRRFPEELSKKLEDKWPCSCNAQHKARSFDIIVSVPVNKRSFPQWKEITIRVTEL